MSRYQHITGRDIHTFQGVQDRNVPHRPTDRYRWLSPSVALLVIACALAMPDVGSAQAGPFSPDAIDLPVIGRVHGELPRPAGDYEYFGERAYGIGDVNHDGLNDWIVKRERPDLSVKLPTNPPQYLNPTELLLYRSTRDSIPNIESGERIGSQNIISETDFLTSGDWDADGNIDLCVKIKFFYDSSFGNTRFYNIFSVVVFWGNINGIYSCDDTSHISCGADMWIFVWGVTSMNVKGKMTLIIAASRGYSQERTLVDIPQLSFYSLSNGKRWGRAGVSSLPVWTAWRIPFVTEGGLTHMDQDGDGIEDFIFIYDSPDNASTGKISVLYGRANDYPDTNSLETADLLYANGHKVKLFDVTGDGIPEIITHAGSEEYMKVFIGFKGQRITEQYGSGIEPPHPGQEKWWGKPWVKLPLPYYLGGGRSEDIVLAVGDCDLDGIADIGVFGSSTIFIYGTGDHFDEYADAVVDMQDYGYAQWVSEAGVINSSGLPAKLISGQGWLVYAAGTSRVRKTVWGTLNIRPAGTEKPTVDVPREVASPGGARLTIEPSVSRGIVHLEWDLPDRRSSATITVMNLLGEVAEAINVPAGASVQKLDVQRYVSGRYLVRVSTESSSVTNFLIVP